MSLNKKISFETEICENITPRWLYAEGGTAWWNTPTSSFVRPILRPNAARASPKRTRTSGLTALARHPSKASPIRLATNK